MQGTTHIAERVAASIVVAELLGYWQHRLMHSGWIPALSTSHMKHHMVFYGPLQKQRPREHYLDATTGKVAIGNMRTGALKVERSLARKVSANAARGTKVFKSKDLGPKQ
jgi:hypothetical protein